MSGPRRAAIPSTLVRAVALAAIAFAAFFAWMHPAMLAARHVDWLIDASDWGQSTVGLNAYLRAGDWPGTHEPLIMAPEGTPLLMTDSNPLVALLLKPFASLLPAAGIQIIGPWLLACLLLHVGFAYALIRRHAPDFLTAWLGTALLTLLPTLFNRYGHATLCAHWTILWALWVFVDRARSRSPWQWLAVIAVTGLIHNYLLLMVGAIWASAMLERIARRDWRTVAIQTIGVVILLIAVAAMQGVLGVSYVSTHSYGVYSMALDGIVDPAHPGFAALLPSSPDGDGRAFEGFQYLGAGLLALLVAAIVTRRWQDRGAGNGDLRRLVWLIPALAVLNILAIGNVVMFHGVAIVRIPLPRSVIDALDPVRSSGRLFWPVAYTLVYAAIAAVCRLPARAVSLTLTVALAVQIADIAPMLAAIHHDTARAARPGGYRRTRNPRWDGWIAQASSIEIADTADLPLIEELTWRAVRACRPIRYSYTSRISRASALRIAGDRRRFLAREIDPTRLYVIRRDDATPAELLPRTISIDGVLAIPPERPAPPPAACAAVTR